LIVGNCIWNEGGGGLDLEVLDVLCVGFIVNAINLDYNEFEEFILWQKLSYGANNIDQKM